jgi:hypothetical protein
MDDLIDRLYVVNPDTGDYVVEIALEDYRDVFNDWDRAAMPYKDMDPELRAFLEGCSDDIPLSRGIQIQFFLPGHSYDQTVEERCRRGLANNFRFVAHTLGRSIRRNNTTALYYLLGGVALLSASFLLEPLIGRGLYASVLLEGLFIGGWVFVWETFSTLFIARRPLRCKLREYRRFLDAPVSFRYGPAPEQPRS